MDNTKKLEIGGKVYTFTAKRSLMKTIYQICPSILKTGKSTGGADSVQDSATDFGLDMLVNLDVLFYEMINPAHKLTKEQSDKIFETCCDEYGEDELLEKLIDFAMSVFPQGDQTNKKPIVW